MMFTKEDRDRRKQGVVKEVFRQYNTFVAKRMEMYKFKGFADDIIALIDAAYDAGLEMGRLGEVRKND